MLKSKILKAFALGLCISAFFAGTAFAKSGGGSSPSFGGSVDAKDRALFDKQLEIDLYLFADHADEMAKKDFKVIYTGVAEDYVEIGINPYTDKNAEFLYALFGKDSVKVVASEEMTLYTAGTGVTTPHTAGPDAAVSNINDKAVVTTGAAEPAVDGNEIGIMGSAGDGNEIGIMGSARDGNEIGMIEPAMDGIEIGIAESAMGKAEIDNADNSASDADEEFSIQIESVNGAEDLGDPAAYGTTAEGNQKDGNIGLASAPADDTKTISTQENAKADTDMGLFAPVTIMIIAGGAIIVGGAIILFNKKKA